MRAATATSRQSSSKPSITRSSVDCIAHRKAPDAGSAGGSLGGGGSAVRGSAAGADRVTGATGGGAAA
jgi:hypothetical protein